VLSCIDAHHSGGACWRVRVTWCLLKCSRNAEGMMVWFVIKVKKKRPPFMFVHGWLIVEIRCFTLNCSYLVCFVSIPTFCIILIVPTRISLRRERCLVKAGPRRKEKVSTAADCQWFFCGKNLSYCYKKKGPKQLVKWTFWNKSKKICHISRKLEELGRFLVFFFWKWPHLANRFHWFSNMQYRISKKILLFLSCLVARFG